MRQQTLFDADDVHHWKFEALGGMEGEQRDRWLAGLLVVDRRRKRLFLEDAVDVAPVLDGIGQHKAKLFDVVAPSLGLILVFTHFRKVKTVAGVTNDLVEQFNI